VLYFLMTPLIVLIQSPQPITLILEVVYLLCSGIALH